MHSFEYFNILYRLKIYLIINRSCPYYFFMYVLCRKIVYQLLNRRAQQELPQSYCSIINGEIFCKWSCTELLFINDYQQPKNSHVFCCYFVSFRFVLFFICNVRTCILRHIAYYINLPHSLKPRNNFE